MPNRSIQILKQGIAHQNTQTYDLVHILCNIYRTEGECIVKQTHVVMHIDTSESKLHKYVHNYIKYAPMIRILKMQVMHIATNADNEVLTQTQCRKRCLFKKMT